MVDFDRINDLRSRRRVGAVNVSSGNFAYFDNRDAKSSAESGRNISWRRARCRRGFPSIDIDGEHYWDGGMASNTPLDYVLTEGPQHDLLIFQVDLWSACGSLPVATRCTRNARKTSSFPAARA